MNLANKVTIITGASAGIGEAIAVKFAQYGATLTLAGRNQENLDKVRKRCVEEFGLGEDKIATYSGDINSSDSRRALVQTTIDKFGKLDILVNNAGALKQGKMPWTEEDMADFDVIMETNVRSVVSLTGMCLDYLKHTKGCIVNISSVAGQKPLGASRQFYCMSKAALDMHTQCLAETMAPDGVRVNAVSPGTIPTSIHERLGMSKDAREAFYKARGDLTPLKRVGTPEEIAEAAAFLASDKASYITGHLLAVDGGWAVRS